MSKPIAEHAIGRPATFKLHFDYGDCTVELACEKAMIKNKETVLVREVRPGDICITLDDAVLILNFLGDLCDEGPDGEGWQSDKLMELQDRLKFKLPEGEK